MKFVKSLAVLSAVLLLAACENPGSADGSANGAGGAGHGANGSGIDSANSGNTLPGTDIADRVFFDYDSSVITSEGQATLERQAEWLKKNSDKKITIEGHCDERGTREYNIALGERRAAAVKKYLAGLGVNRSHITTISYGKERPAVVGSDESAWGQNRRGVTVVE